VSALASIVEVAKQGVDVEAFYWSAMNFNRHWRQRVAVALGRGQARPLSRAQSLRLMVSSGVTWVRCPTVSSRPKSVPPSPSTPIAVYQASHWSGVHTSYAGGAGAEAE
jgi:hypothetical protein